MFLLFTDWILSFDKPTVRFTKLLHWGNMGLNFNQENVFDKTHKNHKVLSNMIKVLNTKHYKDRINFTNLPKELFYE